MDVPLAGDVRRQSTQRITPPLDSLLAAVNLLAAADKTDAGAPVAVASHELKQEGWLRCLPVEGCGSLLCVPGTLGFVEDDCVFMGSSAIDVLAEKVVDVLDSRADLASNLV